MRRIFLDMDGVLSDFDGFFLQEFGKTCEDCGSKNEMWRLIHEYDRFFRKLPLMKGAQALYRLATQVVGASNTAILTSGGSSNFFEVAEQKKEFIHEHIDANTLVIVVRDGLDKSAFVQSAGDILIDDWRKNCEAWEAKGGKAIKYETFSQAYSELAELMNVEEAA